MTPEAKARKETPIFSGVLMYFPDAIAEIARCSFVGNEQHNPGTPLHWDRSKSGDEKDALVRHLMEADEVDSDGILHATKVAWRALANLQKEIEKRKGLSAPVGADREPREESEESKEEVSKENGWIFPCDGREFFEGIPNGLDRVIHVWTSTSMGVSTAPSQACTLQWEHVKAYKPAF